MAGMEDQVYFGKELQGKSPTIIGFVSDIFFASKIEVAVKSIDFRIEWFAPDAHATLVDPSITTSQLAEHVTGPGFMLLEKVT